MHAQASSLSDQDIADVAAYFASFEGEPNNVLVAQLLTGRRGNVAAHQDTVFDQAITGFGHVSIVFPGQCCPPFVGGGEEGGFFFFKNAS